MSERKLIDLFQDYRKVFSEEEAFLESLEKGIGEDLWKSAGGHWSSASIEVFKKKSMELLNNEIESKKISMQEAWPLVVRDFHQAHWGESRLAKKEVKPQTQEQKIFWELFAYIWALLQAALVTKTAIFYFGIKSAAEDSASGRVWVVVAIAYSFLSLMWFARRHSKKKNDNSEN